MLASEWVGAGCPFCTYDLVSGAILKLVFGIGGDSIVSIERGKLT